MGFVGLDSTLPLGFVAVTVKVYPSPFTRPLTRQELVVDVHVTGGAVGSVVLFPVTVYVVPAVDDPDDDCPPQPTQTSPLPCRVEMDETADGDGVGGSGVTGVVVVVAADDPTEFVATTWKT
jgi:hypothetical protein